MRLKYLMIDLSKLPNNREVDKFVKYAKLMNLPLKDFDGFHEIELDVTIWRWLKFKIFGK
jgi:hypothetical protein